MSLNNTAQIEEIYKNKSFSILRVPIKLSYYLALGYTDFLLILKLLKSDNIIITSIELYKDQTYDFIPPNFGYHGNDLNECYSLIEEFLGTLITCNNLYYALVILTNDVVSSELKLSLDRIASNKEPLALGK